MIYIAIATFTIYKSIAASVKWTPADQRAIGT